MKAYHILYHTDEDGTAAAAVVYEYLKRITKESGKRVRYFFYKIDYTVLIQSLLGGIHDGDEVFLVDYSFSKRDNLEFILDLADKGINVTWIDHHKTSVDIVKGLKFTDIDIYNYKNLHFYIEDNACGAALAYEYFYTIINGDYGDAYHYRYIDYLAYVNSHDTWRFNVPNTTEFSYGIMGLKHTPRNIFSQIFNYRSDLVNELFDKCHSTEFKSAMQNFVYKIIENGKRIKEYCDTMNKSMLDQYSFECFIRDFTNEKVYKCIVLNKRGNSLVFGDLIDEYDIVIPYIFNGEQYIYSLFSNKDYVDCEQIAKILGSYNNLGGGGHLHAAGFQTHDNIFMKDGVVNISKKLFSFLHKDNKYSIIISR